MIERNIWRLIKQDVCRDDAKPPVPATIARYAVSFSSCSLDIIIWAYKCLVVQKCQRTFPGHIWHSNGMGGDGAWDNRMSDMLKNFDLNSTEVKQQFGMFVKQNMYFVCMLWLSYLHPWI
jgi:hypothetical protein